MLSGWQIAPALRSQGLLVEDIRDYHTDPSTPDHVWLETVGQRGWIALTRDNDIKHSKIALEAIFAAGAHMFCLTPPKVSAPALVELIAKCDPVMQEIATRYAEPFIANLEMQKVVHFVRGGCRHVQFGVSNPQRQQAHRPLP